MNYFQILTGKIKIDSHESFKEKAASCISVYMFDHLVLSSAFLNSNLLATSGATPGACIDLSNWALT